MESQEEYIKGRGAQFRSANPYARLHMVQEHIEGIDEPIPYSETTTQLIFDYPKTIVNKVESPDVGMRWSLNPYQGCEHGCIYCYARNTHQYWGYSAGLDFESKIIAKPNAPKLLRDWFNKKSWQPEAISLSGNTDCYQPAERKLQLTRQLLEVFLEYKNPVSIITKNQLILRDIDLLQDLAKENLTAVVISITSLNEDLRLKLEPRTASYKSRLKVIEELARKNIPVGVMAAPVIPGLNIYDVPTVLKASAGAGATFAGYTFVRLNGSVADLFKDWLFKNYPDTYNKVLHQIEGAHGGSVNDSRFKRRMKGEGQIANTVAQLFKIARNKYMPGHGFPNLDTGKFQRPHDNGQIHLF
ncbi:MAG: PA0069 family radical SAM protein [Bacteroidia bacterium]|nr:PA0069 family radical SAM protein [Bacteroidia bacterium]